jgi:uncharacterized protein (DUF433 family)
VIVISLAGRPEAPMRAHTEYQFLEPRPGSNYRQLFVKGRKIRAEVLYRLTVNPEPQTPEEIAHDYSVPVEAVHEAIHYSQHNEALLRKEREEEQEYIRAHGLDKPPFVPLDYQPES